MANYYTQFSCIFDVGSAENAARARDILGDMETEMQEEGGDYVGFCMQRDQGTSPGALWIYSEENGEPEQVIKFVLRCAEAMDLTASGASPGGCPAPSRGSMATAAARKSSISANARRSSGSIAAPGSASGRSPMQPVTRQQQPAPLALGTRLELHSTS